jgi:hypothetical protein
MGPWQIFALKMAEVLKWPATVIVALVILVTKGKPVFDLLQGATIRLRRKGLTIEILPPIRELPRSLELLTEKKPDERRRDT